MNAGKWEGGASLPAEGSSVASRIAPAGGSTALQGIITVWARDMIRFGREPHRILGSVAQPLLFWLLIGSGLGSTFQPRGFPEDFHYLTFFYPGVIGLTMLFSSIFSTISVINDREHGFLKEMLVSPVARSSIVLGKIAAGAAVAVVQGVILLILAPLAGMPLSFGSVLLSLAVMTVLSVGLTALGLSFAWRMTSTQGFHVVMNLFMFPMWLLSGAMFPLKGVPAVMTALMYANPLTYGVDALRGLLTRQETLPDGFVLFPDTVNLGILMLFSLALVTVALRACREER